MAVPNIYNKNYIKMFVCVVLSHATSNIFFRKKQKSTLETNNITGRKLNNDFVNSISSDLQLKISYRMVKKTLQNAVTHP